MPREMRLGDRLIRPKAVVKHLEIISQKNRLLSNVFNSNDSGVRTQSSFHDLCCTMKFKGDGKLTNLITNHRHVSNAKLRQYHHGVRPSRPTLIPEGAFYWLNKSLGPTGPKNVSENMIVFSKRPKPRACLMAMRSFGNYSLHTL